MDCKDEKRFRILDWLTKQTEQKTKENMKKHISNKPKQIITTTLRRIKCLKTTKH